MYLLGAEVYNRFLLDALGWWSKTNFGALVSIRIYFDAISFVRSNKLLLPCILQLLTNPKIELWFYDCPSAYPTQGSDAHCETFGSMMRMHALTDPSLEMVTLRNLELLTTQWDVDRITRWHAIIDKKKTNKITGESRYMYNGFKNREYNNHQHRTARKQLNFTYEQGPFVLLLGH